MRSLVALGALIALAACGNESTGPGAASVAGTWSLQSYNGNALPFTFLQIGNDKAELLSGSLDLQATGGYSALLTIRTTQNGVVGTQPTSEVGAYTVNGTSVVFRPTDPTRRAATAALANNTLTYASDGAVYVFRKN